MRFGTLLDRFNREDLDRLNRERPRQAPGLATPARANPFPRPHRGLQELDYPFPDLAAVATRCGRICCRRRKINLSLVFAGQKVGVKRTAEHVGLFSSEDPSARDATHVSGMICYRSLRK